MVFLIVCNDNFNEEWTECWPLVMSILDVKPLHLLILFLYFILIFSLPSHYLFSFIYSFNYLCFMFSFIYFFSTQSLFSHFIHYLICFLFPRSPIFVSLLKWPVSSFFTDSSISYWDYPFICLFICSLVDLFIH